MLQALNSSVESLRSQVKKTPNENVRYSAYDNQDSLDSIKTSKVSAKNCCPKHKSHMMFDQLMKIDRSFRAPDTKCSQPQVKMIFFKENNYDNEYSSIDDRSELSPHFDSRSQWSSRQCNVAVDAPQKQGRFACNISRRPPVTDNRYIYINV